jgi:hypothetical protein
VPTPSFEETRHLARAREQVRSDLMRCRHRISSLLLHGRVFEPSTWTKRTAAGSGSQRRLHRLTGVSASAANQATSPRLLSHAGSPATPGPRPWPTNPNSSRLLGRAPNHTLAARGTKISPAAPVVPYLPDGLGFAQTLHDRRVRVSQSAH